MTPMVLAALAVGQIDSEAGGLDCGTAALYTLLRLEEHDIDFDALRTSLGPTPARGHSLLDLREAAGRAGLTLEGVRYETLEGLDRPILAHLDRSPHGHFIVVRPVGHTGKLVQVFDGPAAPTVIDGAKLRASPGWTGTALRPKRRIGQLAGAALVGLAALGLLAGLTHRRLTRRLTPGLRR